MCFSFCEEPLRPSIPDYLLPSPHSSLGVNAAFQFKFKLKQFLKRRIISHKLVIWSCGLFGERQPWPPSLHVGISLANMAGVQSQQWNITGLWFFQTHMLYFECFLCKIVITQTFAVEWGSRSPRCKTKEVECSTWKHISAWTTANKKHHQQTMRRERLTNDLPSQYHCHTIQWEREPSREEPSFDATAALYWTNYLVPHGNLIIKRFNLRRKNTLSHSFQPCCINCSLEKLLMLSAAGLVHTSYGSM